MISGILGLFVNTLTGDDKYSLRNSENLQQPIQMQLSNKQRTFFQFFALFLKSTSNFKLFGKKMTVITYVCQKLRTVKDVVRKMSKKIFFRTSFDSQHAKGSQRLVKSLRQHFCQIVLSLLVLFLITLTLYSELFEFTAVNSIEIV